MPPRVGFVTCVQLGLACMEEILATGGRLDLVLTLPDDRARRKAGRAYLDEFCGKRGIPLLKVVHINDAEAVEATRAHEIDWLCIIGWSQIAGPHVLAAPRHGALGMHPTLLPKGRGRAAIPWAILKGLSETGVTLFRLGEGVDTGPIGGQVRLPIRPDETATTLYDRVNEAHRTLIRECWPRLQAGTLSFTPQDESLASYWPGRTPADGRLEPTHSVLEADRLVRATTRPYPGAFRELEGRVLRIWAGLPSGERPGAPPGSYRLAFRDGTYDATDYEWEAASP